MSTGELVPPLKLNTKGAKFNKSEFSERGQRPPPTSEANGKTMNVTKEELEKATAQGQVVEVLKSAKTIAEQVVNIMETAAALATFAEFVRHIPEMERMGLKDRLAGMTYRELEDLHAAVRNEMQRRLKEEPCNYEEGPYNGPQK